MAKKYLKVLTPRQFVKMVNRLPSKLQTEISRAQLDIARDSLTHFKSSFDKGGFAGGRQKWAPRLKSYPHPTLKDSGTLKNSLHMTTSSGGGNGKVVIFTNNKYSQYHNDPTGTWTRNQFSSEPATQRQFLGRSKLLEERIRKRLERALHNTFKI